VGALPDPITAVAYPAANGELGWRREDIPAALSAIVASGQAILGGEVWVVLGCGRWDGLVPDRQGGPPGVWHWATAPRAAGEDWPTYCRRTAEKSARVIAEMRVEEECAPAVRDRLYFNLTCLAGAGAEPQAAADGGS
jgi:hypothetical protein